MPTGQAANPLLHSPLIPYILIGFVIYFLIFKPQKDKQRERKELLGSLSKNDEVVTAGGIHATIVNVKDTTVVARIDDNVKIELDKEAITTVTKSNA